MLYLAWWDSPNMIHVQYTTEAQPTRSASDTANSGMIAVQDLVTIQTLKSTVMVQMVHRIIHCIAGPVTVHCLKPQDQEPIHQNHPDLIPKRVLQLTVLEPDMRAEKQTMYQVGVLFINLYYKFK